MNIFDSLFAVLAIFIFGFVAGAFSCYVYVTDDEKKDDGEKNNRAKTRAKKKKQPEKEPHYIIRNGVLVEVK